MIWRLTISQGKNWGAGGAYRKAARQHSNFFIFFCDKYTHIYTYKYLFWDQPFYLFIFLMPFTPPALPTSSWDCEKNVLLCLLSIRLARKCFAPHTTRRLLPWVAAFFWLCCPDLARPRLVIRSSMTASLQRLYYFSYKTPKVLSHVARVAHCSISQVVTTLDESTAAMIVRCWYKSMALANWLSTHYAHTKKRSNIYLCIPFPSKVANLSGSFWYRAYRMKVSRRKYY